MPEDRGLLDLLAKAYPLPKPEEYAIAKRKKLEPSNVSGGSTQRSTEEPVFDRLMGAIVAQESGGNYEAVNPSWNPTRKRTVTALGKYQIMDFNLPQWSRKHLGKELTPEEFLKDPAAQDAVYRGQMGEYVRQNLDRYGDPRRAARESALDWYGRGTPTEGPMPKDYADSVMRRFERGGGPVDSPATGPRRPYAPDSNATDALSVLLRGPKKPVDTVAQKTAAPVDPKTKAIADTLLGAASDMAGVALSQPEITGSTPPKKLTLAPSSTAREQQLAREAADKTIAGKREQAKQRKALGAEALRSGQFTAEDITARPYVAGEAPSDDGLGYTDAKGSSEERKNTYSLLAMRAEQEGDKLKSDLYKLASLGSVDVPLVGNVDVGGGLAVALRGAASPVEEVAEVVERWIGPQRLEKKLSPEEEAKFLADVARVDKVDPSVAKELLGQYETLKSRQSWEEKEGDVGDTKNITTGSSIADVALQTTGSLATLLPEIKAVSAAIGKVAPKLTAAQNLGAAMTVARLPQEAIELDKGKSLGETAATLVTSYLGGAAIPKVISGSVKLVEGLKREGSKQIAASLANIAGQTGTGVLQSMTEASIEGREMTSEELAVNVFTNLLLSKNDTKQGVRAQVDSQQAKATEDAAALLPELTSVLESAPEAAEPQEISRPVEPLSSEAVGAEAVEAPARTEEIAQEPVAPTDIIPEETQAKNLIDEAPIIEVTAAPAQIKWSEVTPEERAAGVAEMNAVLDAVKRGDYLEKYDNEADMDAAINADLAKFGVQLGDYDPTKNWTPAFRKAHERSMEKARKINEEYVTKKEQAVESPAESTPEEINPRYIDAERKAVIAALPINAGSPSRAILDYAIQNRIQYEGKSWMSAWNAIQAHAIAKAEPKIMAAAKAKQDAEVKASKNEYKIPEERIAEATDAESAVRDSDTDALPEIEVAFQGKAPRKGKPIVAAVEGAPEDAYNPKGFAEGDKVYTWAKNKVGEARVVGGTVRSAKEKVTLADGTVGEIDVLRVKPEGKGGAVPIHSSMVKAGEAHPYTQGRIEGSPSPWAIREVLTGLYDNPDAMKYALGKMSEAMGSFRAMGLDDYTFKFDPALAMDPNGLLYSLTHEIGHWADYQGQGTLGRGNILGHIGELKKYMGEFMPKPTATEVLTGPSPTRRKIAEELTALSEWLRPYDAKANAEYTKYRQSPKELYADAISALVMNPAKVAEIAPEFVQLFEQNLAKRPKLQEAWTKMQESLQEPPEVKAERIFRSQQEGFDVGTEKLGMAAIEGEASRESRAGAKLDVIRRRASFPQRLLDTFSPVRTLVKKTNDRAQKVLQEARINILTPGGLRTWRKFNADQNTILRYLDTPDAPEVKAAQERLGALKQKIGADAYAKIEEARELKSGMTKLTGVEAAYGEMRGVWDENAAMLRQYNDDIVVPVAQMIQARAKEKGLDVSELTAQIAANNYLGQYIENTAILGEHRKGTASPEWIQPQEAQAVLDYMKKSLGDELFGAIASKTAEARAAWAKEWQEMYAAGVVSKETFESKVSSADSYGKFKGLEYIDVYESPVVREISGMTGKTANPLTTTILQSIQRNVLVKRQKLINEILPLATREDGPGAVEAAINENGAWRDSEGNTLTKDGTTRDGKKALLEYYRDGEKVGVLVDPAIADFINLNPSDLSSKAAQVLKSMRSFTRFNLITASPQFWYSNLARDIRGAIKTAGFKVLPQILKNYRNAYYYRSGAFGKPKGDGILSGLSEEDVRGAFGSGASREVTAYQEAQRGLEYAYLKEQGMIKKGDPEQGSDTYKFMRREGLLSGSRSSIMRDIQRIGGGAEAIDRYVPFLQPWETAVKLGGTATMLKQGLSMREAALFSREYVGTPDTSIRGFMSKPAGTFMMFFNVAAQGNMAAYRMVKNPFTRTGYLTRAFFVNVLPRAFQFAIASGWAPKIAAQMLGEENETTKWLKEMERRYSFYSDFELMRGFNLPLGTVKKEDGSEAVEGLFIPDDEIGLMFGLPEAVANKFRQTEKVEDVDAAMMTLDMMGSAVSYATSLIPGLQPAIELTDDWKDYMLGRRPHDEFRGRYILSEDESKARDAASIMKMLRYSGEQLFGSNWRTLTQFASGDDSGAPVRIGPYKMTRAGIEQRMAQRKEAKERGEAHKRNEIKSQIEGADSPEAAKSIIDSLARSGELSKRKTKDYVAKVTTPEVWKYAYAKMSLEDAAVAYEENKAAGDTTRADFASGVMKQKIRRAHMSPNERIAFKAKYPEIWGN